MRYALLCLSLIALLPAFSRSARAQTSASWQQRVAYEMEIRLNTDTHRMDGVQRLEYTNNSPDTLHVAYFHLYFNAFQPASMMAERNRHLKDPDSRIVPRIFNLGEDEIGFHRIESLTQDGRAVSFEVTDTVLRVRLARPIPPGTSTRFDLRFESQIPLQTRRSGRDNREGIDYSMSQWYPKIAEYDERGWHADPYVGREFYGPYGSFDVRITLPAHYTLGATGTIQNPEAVGHGYQRDTLATREYDPESTLTWHFRAENVHDFAWVADPDYVHERVETPGGPTIHLLYEPDVASRWQRMDQWTPILLSYMASRFGTYAYPQFTVAQAGDGGMEYPMVIFITGRRSPFSLLGVTAHEMAHMWYYSMLGSNESDYSWMDEGFTSYASAEAMAYILNGPEAEANHAGALLNWIAAHHLGFAEPLSTPADWYRTNAAFGIASYSGGEMLVESLGYVLSEEVRDAWLREYYRRFRFRHPNPYDLEKLAEDVSGLRLDWYFEQFTRTTHTLDYAVKYLSSAYNDSTESWNHRIVLKRKDDLVMPVDLRLTLEDSTTWWINVPLGIMEGHKPVPPDWHVADPWLWTYPEYTLDLELDQRILAVELDPDQLTPDRNRLNNAHRLPVQWSFFKPPAPSWTTYPVGYLPVLRYADEYGVGVGVRARGQYLFGDHAAEAALVAWPQVLFSGGSDPDLPGGTNDVSFVDGIDYRLRYGRFVPGLGPLTQITLSAEKHQGILLNEIALERPLGRFPGVGSNDQTLEVALTHTVRAGDRAFAVSYGQSFARAHILSGRLTYDVTHGGDRLRLSVTAGGSLDRLINASQVQLDARKSARLGRMTGRAELRVGLSADGIVRQRGFRLGLASLEDRWRHDAFRTLAGVFQHPLDDVHGVAFEGPGPVAYALGRGLTGPPVGLHTVAGRLALATPPVATSGLLRPLSFELFSSFGVLWNSDAATDAYEEFLSEIGLGIQYDATALPFVGRLAGLSDTFGGLTFFAAFPLWVNRPELIDPDASEFAYRWLIGLRLQ